jgi:hypothetical protein
MIISQNRDKVKKVNKNISVSSLYSFFIEFQSQDFYDFTKKKLQIRTNYERNLHIFKSIVRHYLQKCSKPLGE